MGHKKLVLTDPGTQYPSFLMSRIQKKMDNSLSKYPIFVYMDKDNATSKLEDIVQENPDVELIDNYAEQDAELLVSKHAHIYRANYEVQVATIKGLLDEHYAGNASLEMGRWV